MHAWASIDLEILEQNVKIIRGEVGANLDLTAVVKADAYGHGLSQVVETLDSTSVTGFMVFGLDEAYTARSKTDKPILITGPLDTKELVDAIMEGFIISLYDFSQIALFERFALRLSCPIQVEVKLNTGLNRFGLSEEEAQDFLANSHHFPNIVIHGIFSHLSDSRDSASSQEQLRSLQVLLTNQTECLPDVPIHLASSGSLGHFKNGYLDGVRVGAAIYGTEQLLPGIKPVMSVKTKVMQVRNLESSEGLGYGRLYQSTSATQVAVLPIGYANGLSQAFVNKMSVLIKGKRCQVIGQIAMNNIFVNVTGLDVKIGDEVVVIGTQQTSVGSTEGILVIDLAKATGISHYEIVTRLGRGLPKIF